MTRHHIATHAVYNLVRDLITTTSLQCMSSLRPSKNKVDCD